MSTNKAALKPQNSLIAPSSIFRYILGIPTQYAHRIPKVATFLAFLRALVTAKLVPVLLSFL